MSVITGMLLLVACSSQSPDVEENERIKAQRKEHPVGTDTSVVIPVEEVLQAKEEGRLPEDGADSQQSTGEFKIDEAASRVYLPGTGWVTVDEFWEIYMNDPEKLPQNLEHAALDVIRSAEH